MNICVQVFVWTCASISLGIPRKGMAGSYGSWCMLNFLRKISPLVFLTLIILIGVQCISLWFLKL